MFGRAESDPNEIWFCFGDGVQREVGDVFDVGWTVGTDDVESGVALTKALGEGSGYTRSSTIEKMGVLGVGGGGTDRIEEVGAVDAADFTMTGKSTEPNKGHAIGRGEESAVEGLAVGGVTLSATDGVSIAAADVVAPLVADVFDQRGRGALKIESVNADA